MDSNEKNLDNSLESAMNMTQDEIEKLLAQQQVVDAVVQNDIDDPDLASLLAELEGQNDSDAQGISELLNKSDNNEIVDDEVLALLKSQEEPGPTAYDAQDLFGSDEKVAKEGFFKKLKKKREDRKKDRKNRKDKKAKSTDKEEIPADLEEIEITDMLVEQQDDPLADAFALLQGEEIVEKADEKVDKKTKKKEKKDKKAKKAPKAKNSSEKEEIPEDDEDFIREKSTDKKKSKGKKNKKDKKEKNNKKIPEKTKEKPTIEDAIIALEEELADPPHKNKIIMVFAASILIMLGFLVVNFYFTRHANKKLAEEAYEAEDYLECYQLLYGQKLNDSQTAMFHRSELILRMDILWSHYNDFIKEQKWLEGLDELVQFVHAYPEVSEYAAEWNCQDTVKETYNQVETVLTKVYFTDVQEVAAIAELESDVDYTKALVAIVEEKEKKDALNQKYPDILPEEEERVSQNKD